MLTVLIVGSTATRTLGARRRGRAYTPRYYTPGSEASSPRTARGEDASTVTPRGCEGQRRR